MAYNYTVNYMNYTVDSHKKLLDIEKWCAMSLPRSDYETTKGDDGRFYHFHIHIKTQESAMAYKLRWL